MDAAWNPWLMFFAGCAVGLTFREIGALIFWAFVFLGLSAAVGALTAYRLLLALANRSRS